ncbi:MAG: TerB family tellurite resistance protein [Burkholderiaceae bacterium]|nr:TerB family tellurite resistance protein [Burkholderiaceae bacterium]
MLRTLRELFDTLLPPPGSTAGAAADDEHRLRLATAALLVEVMRADGHFGAAEQSAVRAALVEKFELAPDEAERLVELATSTAQEATDLFGFTTRLNERFTDAQKLRMVELMWAVAYADGQLADHERHLMWRVADLLHVPQGAYVLARQRAAAGGVAK